MDDNQFFPEIGNDSPEPAPQTAQPSEDVTALREKVQLLEQQNADKARWQQQVTSAMNGQPTTQDPAQQQLEWAQQLVKGPQTIEQIAERKAADIVEAHMLQMEFSQKHPELVPFSDEIKALTKAVKDANPGASQRQAAEYVIQNFQKRLQGYKSPAMQNEAMSQFKTATLPFDSGSAPRPSATTLGEKLNNLPTDQASLGRFFREVKAKGIEIR